MSPLRRTSPVRTPIRTAALLLLGAASLGLAFQDPSAPPAPGTRGNADNVPLIGRADPKGNPVRLAKATGHVSNYSEEKVRAYTLPDPLVMAGGERVTSADRWVKARRPEILKFYREEIYGRVPDGAPRVTWEVAETDPPAPGAGGGGGRGGRGGGGGDEAGDGQDGRQAGRPADEPDPLPPGQGDRSSAGSPRSHLRLQP